MTEMEWGICDDPFRMLSHLKTVSTDRKLRLFACACCRRVLHLIGDTTYDIPMLKFAEKYADNVYTKGQLQGRAWGKFGVFTPIITPRAFDAAYHSASYAGVLVNAAARKTCPELVEENNRIFNKLLPTNSLRDATELADSASPRDWINAAKAAENSEYRIQAEIVREIFGNPFRPTASRLCAHDSETFKVAKRLYGSDDFQSLDALAAVLAEEFGNDELIAHCNSSSVHYRGCWVIDYLLGLG